VVTVAADLPAADPPSAPAAARPRRRLPTWGLAAAILTLVAAVGVSLGPRILTGAQTPVTIAVLPFAYLGADRSHDYVADGLTEETITSLGRVAPAHVSVLARTTMMRYEGRVGSLAAIGRELGADFLIEASVREEAGRVRIAVRLIRASDERQVWTSTYERERASVLALQQELSADIARQTWRQLTAASIDTLARRQTRVPAAYDAYLRGLDAFGQRSAAGNRHAVLAFEEATRLDPGYALAWATLSHTLAASVLNADVPPAAVESRARAAALTARRLAPDLAEAQFALGFVDYWSTRKWAQAQATLAAILARHPSFTQARVQHGHVLSQLGRHHEAREELRLARELEPFSGFVHAISSQVAFQGGDLPGAVEHARRTIVIEPQLWIGYQMLGQALAVSGDHDAAVAAFLTAEQLSGANSKPLSGRGHALALAGRTAEARGVLAGLQGRAAGGYVPPFARALVHAGLGERDAAFAALEEACDLRDVHLIYLPVDPRWEAIRGDARYRALLVRCPLPADGDAAVPGTT
jgi:TolB-like protein